MSRKFKFVKGGELKEPVEQVPVEVFVMKEGNGHVNIGHHTILYFNTAGLIKAHLDPKNCFKTTSEVQYSDFDFSRGGGQY